MAGEDGTIKLGYDGKKVEAGFSNLESRAKSSSAAIESRFARTGAAIGSAFAFAGGIAAIRSFAAEMGDINDLATRFGVSAESIQRLQNVAQLAGTDIETLARLLSKLTVEAAKNGDQFEALGISASQFANASLDQQVVLLAKAYEGANEDQTKMVQLMDLLGNKGQQVLPLLASGAKELADEMNNVSVVTEGSVQAMAQLDDTVDEFGQNMKAAFGVAIQESRVFLAAVDAILKSGGSLEKFTKDFNAASEAIVHPALKDRNRKGFDPERFAADQGGGGVAGKDPEALAAEKKARAAKELELDLAIADAKAKGNEKLQRALEREKQIRADQRRIVNEVGLDGVDARRVAEQLNPLTAAKEPEAKALDDRARRKIRGYSGAQRDKNPFLDRRTFDEFFTKDQRMARSKNSADFQNFFHPKQQNAAADQTSVLTSMLAELKRITTE